jgi:hypothetical protein
MTLRNQFMTKTMAATALALGLSGGVALAQAPQSPAQSQPKATQITPANNNNKGQLVTTWSPVVDPINPLGSHVPLDEKTLLFMIAGLGLLTVGAGAYASKRGVKGAWLRAGAGGLIALTLLNPEILREDREKLPTLVLKVVDKTESNKLDNRAQTTAAMSDALDKSLANVKGIEVRTIEVSGVQDGAAVDGTNPFTAIRGLTDIPRDQLGAVIMLTDGQVHDIPAAPDALGKGVPLQVLVSGQQNERDRRIVIDSAPYFGLVNKKQDVVFHVQDQGVPAGTSGPVRVTITSEGKQLSTQTVTPGQSVKMSVDIPHAGPNIIEFRTEPLKGELTEVNNQAVATIEGIRDQLNVMLISGAPNPDTRVFRDLLKSDPDGNLIHFMIQRLPTQLDSTPDSEMALAPFPSDEVFADKLNKFNLIIFDHFDDQGVLLADYLQNIAEFVKKGGAVLVVAGDEYTGPNSLFNTALGPVLPVTPGAQADKGFFTPQITDLGKRHPVTRDLDPSAGGQPSWGPWALQVEAGKTSGEVVMTGPDKKPLLILNQEGKGRVAVLMSNSLHLWKDGFQGGGPYAELVERISHWLMKDPALEEEALRMSAQDGKLVIERQTVDEKTTPITVHTPSGRIVTATPEAVSPGLWRATIPTDELGLYSAEQGGKHPVSSFINIGPVNPKEFVNTLSTLDLLKPFTDGTGGRIDRMTDAPGHLNVPRIEQVDDKAAANGLSGADWIGIHMRDASNLKDTNRIPIIPPWVALLVGLGLYAGARYREGDHTKPLFGKKAAPGKDDGPS